MDARRCTEIFNVEIINNVDINVKMYAEIIKVTCRKLQNCIQKASKLYAEKENYLLSFRF